VDLGAGVCGGLADEADDDLAADRRSSAPVVADEAEQRVLDAFPLAGAGWDVTDVDLEADIVRELLRVELPQPGAVAVWLPQSAVIVSVAASG